MKAKNIKVGMQVRIKNNHGNWTSQLVTVVDGIDNYPNTDVKFVIAQFPSGTYLPYAIDELAYPKFKVGDKVKIAPTDAMIADVDSYTHYLNRMYLDDINGNEYIIDGVDQSDNSICVNDFYWVPMYMCHLVKG